MDEFHNRNLGRNGEDLAAELLEKKGFELLDRNFRFGRCGEIDIIARRGNLLVFVEVKARNTEKFGGALLSISKRKKTNLRRAAQGYLISHEEMHRRELTCRFDLISLESGRLEWHEDILR